MTLRLHQAAAVAAVLLVGVALAPEAFAQESGPIDFDWGGQDHTEDLPLVGTAVKTLTGLMTGPVALAIGTVGVFIIATKLLNEGRWQDALRVFFGIVIAVVGYQALLAFMAWASRTSDL